MQAAGLPAPKAPDRGRKYSVTNNSSSNNNNNNDNSNKSSSAEGSRET